MPKILLNPFRNNLSIQGLTLRHDELLDQPVLTTSDVTFNSIKVGDLEANGNIYFSGNVTEVETTHLTIRDNIIDINQDNDVPLLRGGFSIYRGSGLDPFNIFYDEPTRLFRIGLGDDLQAVATRQDNPEEGDVAVWNNASKRFDVRNRLSNPFNFENDTRIEKRLQFSPPGLDLSLSPFITGETSGDLRFNVRENIILGALDAQIGRSIIIPFGRKLSFDTSHLYSDNLGGLVVDTSTVMLPNRAKISWGNLASLQTTNAGADILISGGVVSVNSTTSFSIDNASPLIHGNVVTMQPISNGAYSIASTGDMFITPATGYDIVFPSFTLNKKVKFDTDAVGNMGLNSIGDIFLSPKKNVMLNPEKSIAFGGNEDMFITVDVQSGNMIVNSTTTLVLQATDGVFLPQNVPLLIGNKTTIWETLDGTSNISSDGDINFVPVAGKSILIPRSTKLTFATGETIVSDGSILNINATSLITLTAAQGVSIPQTIPLSFGDDNHKIYQDSHNNLYLTSSHQIILKSEEQIVLDTSSLSIGNTLIYEDVDGALSFKSGINTNYIKSVDSFFVASLDEATDTGTGSLMVSGGTYISKNLIVSQDTLLSKRLTVANTVTIDDATVPILITNSSNTNGTALGFTAKWDYTGGFTIGRGTPDIGGGRSFAFTLPSYNSYGIGDRPNFHFGSVNDTYMILDNTGLNLTKGIMYITDETNDALIVKGGANVNSLTVLQGLSAGGNSFQVSGTETIVNTKLVFHNSITGLFDNGNQQLFTMDHTGNTFYLDTLFWGAITMKNGATLEGSLLVTENTTLQGNLDMQHNKILNLRDPQSEFEPATKNYVDMFLRGLSAKDAVLVATTEEIDLAASQYNIDDVPLTPGTRILVKNQTNLVENGIYVLDASNVPKRSNDLIEGIDVSGSSVFVTSGTINGVVGFVVVGNPVVVGQDDLKWTPFTGSSQIIVSDGLTKDGNVFKADVDNSTISIDPGNSKLRIHPGFISNVGLVGGALGVPVATSSNQSHVTTIGTIITGKWNADVISVAHGGTGVSTIRKGFLVVGNGSDPLETTENIYINGDTGNIGINTVSPQSNLHVVNTAGTSSGTWLRLEDTAALLNQGSGVSISSISNNAKIALRSDGTLNISQEDFTNSSKITLSTQRVTRLSIDNYGSVVVGSNAPLTGNILTIYGKFTSTGAANIRGDLILPSLTIREDSTGTTILDGQFIKISNGFDVGADATIGNFKIISTVAGETSIVSSERATGLGLPLYLRTSTTNTSAVCISNGLLVPNKLQIGGVVGNVSSGFSIYTDNDNLHFTPGIQGAGVLFNAPMSFGEGLSLYDKGTSNDFVTLSVSTTYLRLQTKTTTVSSPYDFVVGGGTNEIITTFTNKANSAYIKYDPTFTSEYSGGVFSVSNHVLATFGSEVRLMDILRFNVGNSIEGVLGNTGWYYLGLLGIGRTTMTASLSWRLRIDYDGVSHYAVTILNYDRNVASLNIFKSDTGVYHLFIRVISGPCRISIVESPNRLYFSRYEGGSNTPNGQFSSYGTGWTLDLDSIQSQSNAQLDLGTINVLSSATLNNTSMTGAATVAGSLTVNGPSNFVGDSFVFSDPATTLPNMSMGKDVDNVSNVLTLHGSNTSSPAVIFDRSMTNGSIGMMPSNAPEYADALLISHNNNDPSSQIVFSTRKNPAAYIDGSGNMSLLSLNDNIETGSVGLLVKGGAIFDKRVLFRGPVYGTEFRVTNATTGNYVPIFADDDLAVNYGNARISNLADPIDLGDAVNMRFVQGLIQGLSAKDSVIAASANSNVDLSVPLTVLDETVLEEGDRVLVKNQTNPVENGIYVIKSGAQPERTNDLEIGDHAAATFVFVSQGTTNANSGWICSTVPGQDVVGVNAINFTQFSGAGQFNAGAGLAKIGNTIVVLVDGVSLEVVNNNLRVKSTIAGEGLTGGSGEPLRVASIDHLNSVGTLTYGRWNASVIDMAYGGTGSSNFNVGRVIFSNGVSLTQGSLFFDDTNVRLGINTTSPVSGLTLQDRDIQISQSVASPSYIILSSSVTNYTFAIRNDASKLCISSGTGSNKLALTDVVTLDNAGVLSVSNTIATNAMLLSSSTRMTGTSMESIVSGPMVFNMYSLDNTGTYFNMYGGMGTSANRANSEFLRFGYYNAQYVMQTSASGVGTVRNLCLQAGTNTNQFMLLPNGNAIFNTGTVIINGTRDATSLSDGGSLTVLGGAAFNGTVYAKSIYTTVTGDASITSAGGISGVKMILSGTYQNYVFASNTEGRLNLYGSRTSTDTVLQLASFDANNANNVVIRTFGLGQDTAATSEWLQIGYEKTSAAYGIRTQQGGAASSRPLILSANAILDQMVLNTDGSVMVSHNFTTIGNVTVSSTQDATGGSDFAALSVAGGIKVKKSIYVGNIMNVPTMQVSGHLEMSASGSVDNTRISYSSNGNVNIYNNSNNVINIHTGNSVGPSSINQEKLILGYGSSSHHVIHSFASGTGVVKDLVLTTGANVDQMRLVATDNSVRFSGAVQIQSPTDAISALSGGSLTIAGGAAVSKSLYVGASASIGSGSINPSLLTLRGANTWSIVSVDANNMQLQSSGTDSIFSFADKTGAQLFSVDTVGKSVLSKTTTNISVSNIKAFSIQNALNINMFTFDTVNHILDMNSGRISNVADPQSAGDVANKKYVDNLIKGLNLKGAARVAASANVDLTKTVTIIDGVTVAEGWRVLLMYQTNAVENGIYIVTAGLLRRADDLAYGMRAAGAFCFVEMGAFRGDKGYVCIADYPNDLVGTNALSFTQFNGNIITAGLGLYKDGNNIMNIQLAADGGLSFNGNNLVISPSFAGTGLTMNEGILSVSPITSVSTITAGKWQGSIVEMAYGGTGSNVFPQGHMVYSDGSRLTSTNSLIFDDVNIAVGINGTPDPHLMKDGLRTVDRDICLQGVNGGLYFADQDAVYNWGIRRFNEEQNNPIKTLPALQWKNVVMSKDGTVVIAFSEIGSNDDYISKNGGYNWDILLNDGLEHEWGECVMSYDGSVILMCASEEYLFVSNDKGETFSRAVTNYPRVWEWCSISDNGQYALASSLADGMFKSSNSGLTWTLVSNIPTDPIDLGFVHVSKDGSVQFAGYFGGPLYESRDHGATFTQRTDLRSGNWYDIAESRDSNVLVMYEDTGSLWVSTNMGLTWNEKLTDVPRRWVNATVSPDGTAMAAADNTGYIWYSSNYGSTWTSLFGNLSAQWTFAQISEDGRKIVAGGSNIPLYVAKAPSLEYEIITSKNMNVSAGVVSPNGTFYYGDFEGSMYRYLLEPSSDIVISAGKSNVKSDLVDFIVMNDRKQMGIGYDALNAGYISRTLDVNGTMYVEDTVEFGVPLGTGSGGTGNESIPYGLVIANGTDPFTSTSSLPSGAVPIGSSDGTGEIVIETGDVLRSHLGLGIGLDVQAYSINLENISTLSPIQGYFIMGTGTNFTMGTASAAAESMGLGRLAYLENVNNDYFSGTPISVLNGGTGNTNFTSGRMQFFNGTSIVDTTISFDNVKKGIAVNGTGTSVLPVGSSLSVHSGDISLVPVTGGSVPSGLLFHNIDGDNVFRIRAQNDGTFGVGNASLVISGGVPNANKSLLTDRVSILSSGEVTIASVTDATVVGTGALRIAGGGSFEKSLYIGGNIINAGTEDSSISTNGGISVAKGVTAASLTISGTSNFSSVLDATSTTVAGTTFSGGIAIAKSMYVGNTINIAYTSAIVPFLQLNRNDGSDLLQILQVGTGATSYVRWRLPTGGLGRLVINAGTGGDYLDMSTLGIISVAPVTINNTSTTAISTTGGIQCSKGITSNGVVNSTVSSNAMHDMVVENTNSGSSAYVMLRLKNNNSEGYLYLNSSARSGDGGVGTMTLRNNAGALRLQGSGQNGMVISSSGNVVADGTITTSSTTDATSTTAAMVSNGGLLVKKSLYVASNITVNGSITVTGSTSSPTVTTVAGDLVNVTNLTIKSAKVVTTNMQNVLYITFKVTPTAPSLNTQFTFDLPNKSTAFVEALDLENGQCSGYTDVVNYIVLQNTLCTGVPGSTKAMVKFQSVNTTIHYLQVMVAYTIG